MKIDTFLLTLLILVSVSSYAQDSLMLAIKRSDLRLIKKEISTRTFTMKEQLLYLNFCEEVIIRRRDTITKSYAQLFFTPAFTTDSDVTPSIECLLRGLVGFLGIIISIPLCEKLFKNRVSDVQILNTIVSSEIVSFGLVIRCILEINAQRVQDQEQLYENAIVIKHLMSDVEII